MLLSGCTPVTGAAPPLLPPLPRPAGTLTPAPRSSASGRPAVAQPTVEKIDAELQVPWSTVFLPDGTAVISERETALLRSIAPGSGSGRPARLARCPTSYPAAKAGCWGWRCLPDFARDRYLYAYFTAAADNRIARLRLEERAGRLELGASEVIFSGIPKATHA